MAILINTGKCPNLYEGVNPQYDCTDPQNPVALTEMAVFISGVYQPHNATQYLSADFPNWNGGDGSDYARSYYRRQDGSIVLDADRPEYSNTSADPTCGVVPSNDELAPDTASSNFSAPVEIDVLANDMVGVDIDTVQLIDPISGDPVDSVTVPGEGVWAVNPTAGTVTFTPDPGLMLDPTPIAYTGTSSSDPTATPLDPALITLTYVPSTAPMAEDDVMSNVPSDGPVTLDVLANDSDPEDDIDPSTLQLIDPATGEPASTVIIPDEGTWSVGPGDGEVTFTPVAGLSGPTTPVAYVVEDEDGNASDPATVSLAFQEPPVVEGDEVSVPAGSSVTIDVVGNDSDPDSSVDPATVMLLDPSGSPVTNLSVPGEGVWNVDPTTGAVTFTPDPALVGSPTPVSYVVDDVEGNTSEPASLTVTFQQPPMAMDDTIEPGPSGPIVVDVLANDSDPDSAIDPASVMLVDPATGDPATELIIPGEGTWNVDPNTGAINFTPEMGYQGDPTPVSYTIADEEGNISAPAMLAVVFENPPEVVDDEATDLPTGSPVTIDVLANDSDSDGDIDPTSVQLLDDTGSPTTTLAVPDEGLWSVNPITGLVTFAPEAGFTEDPSPVNYQVSDLNGGVSGAAEITADYLRPPIITPDTVMAPVGQPVTVDALATDVGQDSPLDPTSVMLLDPATGNPVTTLTVPGEGEWVVDPTDGSITFTPEPGFEEDPTPVSYQVQDEAGSMNEPAEISIDYQNAPDAVEDMAQGLPGQPVTVDVLANDTDLEGDVDPSSVMVLDPVTGAPSDTVVVPGEGTWAADPATGEVTFTPEPGFSEDPTPIIYQVSDDQGNNDTAAIEIAYNSPPDAVDDSVMGLTATPVTVSVLTNDSDVDGDLDPASLQLVEPNTGNLVGNVVIPGEGSWVANPATGEVTFTPEPGFNSDPTPIEYSISDAENLSSTASIIIDYEAPPVVVDDSATGNEGDAVTVDVLANDSDLDGDLDPATLQLLDGSGNPVSSLPVPGEGTWDIVAGEVVFTPEPGFAADPTPVNYQVEDAEGNSGTGTVAIAYNLAPDAQPDTGAGLTGDPVTVDVVANDSDPDSTIDPTTVMVVDPGTGNPVTSLVVPGEGQWDVDPATGEITFTPEAGFSGDPTPVDYTVADEDGAVSDPSGIVIAYSSAPVAEDDSATANEGEPVVVDILANDSDADGDLDPTTAQIIDPGTGNPVSNLTVPGEGQWDVDPATGALTFTPEAGYAGDPTPVTYQVSDSEGNADTAMVVVDYNAAPDSVDDSGSGVAGNPTTVDVLANDTDPDSTIDPTSVELIDPAGNPASSVTVPGEGTWDVDPATGDITFTPDPALVGSPSPIDYQVADTDGAVSDPATLTLAYSAPPVATDDSANGVVNSPATIDVLANDTDPDGDLDPASLALIDPATGSPVTSYAVPGEGTWDVVAGQVVFTPEPGYVGSPTPAVYQVADSNGSTDTGIIAVIYSHPPVAVEDCVEPPTVPLTECTEDSTLSFSQANTITNIFNQVEDFNRSSSSGTGTVAIQIDSRGADGLRNGPDGNPHPEGDYELPVVDGTLQLALSSCHQYAPESLVLDVNLAAGFDNGLFLRINGIEALWFDNSNFEQAPGFRAGELLNPNGAPIFSWINGGGVNPSLEIDVANRTIRLMTDDINGGRSDALPFMVPATKFTLNPAAFDNLDPVAGIDIQFGPASEAGAISIQQFTFDMTVDVEPGSSGVVIDGAPTTIDVLANDTDDGSDIDPTTVELLDPADSVFKTSVTIAGEGTWDVDPATGVVTFTPVAGLTASPTTLQYRVADSQGDLSNNADILIKYPATGPLANDYTFSDLDKMVTTTVALNADRACEAPAVSSWRVIAGSESNVAIANPDSPNPSFDIEVGEIDCNFSFDYEIYCDGAPSGQVGTISGSLASGTEILDLTTQLIVSPDFTDNPRPFIAIGGSDPSAYPIGVGNITDSWESPQIGYGGDPANEVGTSVVRDTNGYIVTRVPPARMEHFGGRITQVPFPGDPAYDVPATNTFYYCTGNSTGAPYNAVQTTVTGVVPGQKYRISLYSSNAVDPLNTDLTDNALLSWQMDGASISATDEMYLHSQPESGHNSTDIWDRTEIEWTAPATSTGTHVLAIFDEQLQRFGDDVALTQVMMHPIIPCP